MPSSATWGYESSGLEPPPERFTSRPLPRERKVDWKGEDVLLLIDSHAHIDSSRYAEDREPMLRRAHDAGVDGILAIGIGEGPSEMHRALELCREFGGKPGMPRLWASAGVYPHNTQDLDDAALDKLDRLLSEPEVIACGELGFDYFYEGTAHEVQRAGLLRQLEVAAARKRPITIHCRPTDGSEDAWEELFPILDAHWRSTGLGGIMHCFAGSEAVARRALEMGFLLSFSGSLTFRKAQPLRDVAAKLPLDCLLVETDAPYLAPMPDRGKRNEPAWVVRTARVLAECQGREVSEIVQATTKNFFRLFGLQSGVGN